MLRCDLEKKRKNEEEGEDRGNNEHQVPRPFMLNSKDQIDKPPKHGEKYWTRSDLIHE